MIAVITAGGKGTRLTSVASDIPKPMVRVAGKPILERQIECLKESGVTDVYFLIGHLGHVIKDYFGDGSSFGIRAHYIEEPEPLGSAGALACLRETINEDFLFVFGDLVLDIDFVRMMAFHKEHKASITLLAHPNSHPFDSDLIVSAPDGLVVGIDSKYNVRDYFYHNLVNAGVYVLSPNVLHAYFGAPQKVDFEKDIVLPEIQRQSVYAYRSTEYVKDAGTPDRYQSVCEDVESGIVRAENLKNPQKAIFLDRDGTINKYKGFIRNLADIELEEKAATGLKQINRSEYLAIVITNQPVIARGEVTESELQGFHNKIETLLGKEGAYYDDLFYCPHHPDKGFEGEVKELKIDCDCRKPKIGLIKKAQEKYNIDLSKSYFVGDSTMDIQTGVNAGMKTILVQTGNKGEDGKYPVHPDYVIDGLDEIMSVVKGDKR